MPGNVYVVEENSKKLIATESLDKDKVFSLDFDTSDEDVHMRLKEMGMDPLNLKFSLYFVPQQQAEEVNEEALLLLCFSQQASSMSAGYKTSVVSVND